MLEHYFKDPTHLRKLRFGPFAGHIDDLAKELRCSGYAKGSAKMILSMVGKFNYFSRLMGIENAEEINETLIERFLKVELAAQGDFSNAPNVMNHLKSHLQSKGIIKIPAEIPNKDPMSILLHRFDLHLKKVRGLADISCKSYMKCARSFLNWLHEHYVDLPLNEICGNHILDYIMYAMNRPNRRLKRPLCTQIKMFLRYLHWEGITQTSLDRTVPKVAYWRLSNIPRHLPWEQVRALIDSIDTNYPNNMRDRAILLLIATLGLRNREVRSLQFNHISWQKAEIRLPYTKNGKERVLPMPQEVGEAIADYAMHGRPSIDSHYVFLRHHAPCVPFISHGAISSMVERRLGEAEIDAPCKGSHMLRHSLATRMVNVGVPIREIADILGHTSIDTTAIYTKVDITNLSAVAMPFAGRGVK